MFRCKTPRTLFRQFFQKSWFWICKTNSKCMIIYFLKCSIGCFSSLWIFTYKTIPYFFSKRLFQTHFFIKKHPRQNGAAVYHLLMIFTAALIFYFNLLAAVYSLISQGIAFPVKATCLPTPSERTPASFCSFSSSAAY